MGYKFSLQFNLFLIAQFIVDNGYDYSHPASRLMVVECQESHDVTINMCGSSNNRHYFQLCVCECVRSASVPFARKMLTIPRITHYIFVCGFVYNPSSNPQTQSRSVSSKHTHWVEAYMFMCLFASMFFFAAAVCRLRFLLFLPQIMQK